MGTKATLRGRLIQILVLWSKELSDALSPSGCPCIERVGIRGMPGEEAVLSISGVPYNFSSHSQVRSPWDTFRIKGNLF